MSSTAATAKPPLPPGLALGPICPACGQRQAYQLGDGRLKCKACRLKYTPQRKPGRLDDFTVRRLVRHFWSMAPIEATAQELGVDRKTVQRYFSLVRRAIARAGDERMSRQLPGSDLQGFFVGRFTPRQPSGPSGGKTPVFGLVRLADSLGLVFPSGAEDWSGLELDGLRFVGLNEDASGVAPGQGQAEAFWKFARERLKHYRGGFKRHLGHYLREMEFRYNHRDDPQAQERLYRLLDPGPQWRS
jgi:transposase